MDVKGMMRREGINRRLRSEGVLPPLPDPAIRQVMALEDERAARAEAQPVEPEPAQRPAYQYPPQGDGGPGDGPPEGFITYPFPVVDEVRAERALDLALALIQAVQTYQRQGV